MMDIFQNEKIESLQNIAIKIIEQEKYHQNQQGNNNNNNNNNNSISMNKEKVVFVLGSRRVGKTTIINKFFDRDDEYSSFSSSTSVSVSTSTLSYPTLALDYSYTKRSSSDLYKQIFSIWELGSLENSDELIEIPLQSSSDNLKNFSIIIVLDLSEPDHIWSDLSRAIKNLRVTFSKIVHNKIELSEYYEKAIKRISTDNNNSINNNNNGNGEHLDLKTLNLFPLPILIVGGKYDIFQDFDPEIKKQICIFLRSVSHILGASLLYYSKKNSILSKTIRDTLNHFGFDSPSHPFRKICYDYNEPLCIWFGCDSWNNIGLTVTIEQPIKLEMFGINFSNRFPQINEGMKALPDDPAKDIGFKESVIDEMKSQKDEELQILLKGRKNIKSKFEIIGL